MKKIFNDKLKKEIEKWERGEKGDKRDGTMPAQDKLQKQG
jgi:hypothetical protein